MDEPKPNRSNRGVCRLKFFTCVARVYVFRHVYDKHRNVIASHTWRNPHKHATTEMKRSLKRVTRKLVYIYAVSTRICMHKGNRHMFMRRMKCVIYTRNFRNTCARACVCTWHRSILKETSAHSGFLCSDAHPGVYPTLDQPLLLLQCVLWLVSLH